MQNLRKIASHYILTQSGLRRNGLLTTDSAGTVLSVDFFDEIDSVCGVEFYSGILIPGMVNAHSHIELSYLAGAVDEGCGFSGFARQLSEVRNRFTEQQKHDSVSYHDARMWADGVSAVGDISNSADSFGVKSNSKITYHTFLEAYGLRAESLSAVEKVEHEALRCGIPYSVTPHSTYSLNERLFLEAVGKTRDGVLSIHFMESPGEAELYNGTGEMHQWYEKVGFTTDFTSKYASPADRIIANIPSGRKILLVHNTFITEEDASALAAHFGNNLTWVLCPLSNKFITGSLPPVDILSKTGTNIAVGTDSLASNHTLSLIDEIRQFPDVPLEERLNWITSSGASALGLDHTLGSFEAGKRPGAVILENLDLRTLQLTPQSRTRRII